MMIQLPHDIEPEEAVIRYSIELNPCRATEVTDFFKVESLYLSDEC